jgi:hypothetical protein
VHFGPVEPWKISRNIRKTIYIYIDLPFGSVVEGGWLEGGGGR